MKNLQQEAIDLCVDLEEILRPQGFHVGLTGSRLYGNGKKNDIDVIVYPHANVKNDPKKIVKILEECGVKIELDATPDYPCYVVIGELEGRRIDFFILNR